MNEIDANKFAPTENLLDDKSTEVHTLHRLDVLRLRNNAKRMEK